MESAKFKYVNNLQKCIIYTTQCDNFMITNKAGSTCLAFLLETNEQDQTKERLILIVVQVRSLGIPQQPNKCFHSTKKVPVIIFITKNVFKKDNLSYKWQIKSLKKIFVI